MIQKDTKIIKDFGEVCCGQRVFLIMMNGRKYSTWYGSFGRSVIYLSYRTEL